MESEIIELKKTLSSMEMELKANRGTIARLAAEAEQQHKHSSQYLSQIQTFMKEKEQQELLKKDFITKIDELKAENEKKQDEVLTLTENFNRMENNVSEENSSFKQFRAKVLKLLFGFEDDKLSDEKILEKISELKENENERKVLKKENEKLSTFLKDVPDESEMKKVKTKLKSFEVEMTEMSACLEEKKKQEGKMMKFVNTLGNAIGVHKEELEPDLDSLTEAILFRGKQLYRNEGSLVTDQKTQIYSLQRKIKSVNEMLASKNFHLDLLKRKLSSLEDHKFNKSDFEKEKDEACVKAKKLMKLVENYKKELARSANETKDLREKLQTALILADENQSREDKLEELAVQKLDLETLCRELNSKIESLKKDKNDGRRVKERIKEEHEKKTRDLLEALDQKSSSILKLEEYVKQCNTFKQKLSEMLTVDLPLQGKSSGRRGKDFNSDTVLGNKSAELSEEDIIERMKMLIETSKQNAATAYVLDSALSDMAEGLKAGYHKAAMSVNGLPRPETLGSFERNLKSLMSQTKSTEIILSGGHLFATEKK